MRKSLNFMAAAALLPCLLTGCSEYTREPPEFTTGAPSDLYSSSREEKETESETDSKGLWGTFEDKIDTADSSLAEQAEQIHQEFGNMNSFLESEQESTEREPFFEREGETDAQNSTDIDSFLSQDPFWENPPAETEMDLNWDIEWDTEMEKLTEDAVKPEWFTERNRDATDKSLDDAKPEWFTETPLTEKQPTQIYTIGGGELT